MFIIYTNLHQIMKSSSMLNVPSAHLDYFNSKFNHILNRIKEELEWWQTGVVYQVYTKSFKDSNDDGIGDLRGIADQIDYLKHIGVNIIWLNPIYPSGGKDNGYDVTSFTAIDPIYGTMDDFDYLLHKLHKNGNYLMPILFLVMVYLT